jgi:hypothetical protein
VIPSLLLLSLAHAGEITVVGSLLREAELQPGGKAEGAILVRNTDDVPHEVLVYLRDYRFTADGRNDYDDPGTLERSNSAWVKVSPGTLHLAPGEATSVWYTMEPPADASLEGSYWSMLMIEPAPEPEPVGAAPRSIAVRTVVRYGVQLVAHVGGEDAGVLSFDRFDLARADGRTTLALDVANAGARMLSPKVWAEVFDASGTSLGRFTAHGQPALLPGCSSRLAVDLTGLPDGSYTALVVADAGDDRVFGAQVALDVR